jgi:hypothetical protein
MGAEQRVEPAESQKRVRLDALDDPGYTTGRPG